MENTDNRETESSMGICTNKSAGWRSMDNTEYTAGRVDKGTFVTKNMTKESKKISSVES